MTWTAVGDLATTGFALVMFVSGSHVPVRHLLDGRDLRTGAVRAAMVGGRRSSRPGRSPRSPRAGIRGVYAVLLASSSAAVVIPVLERHSLKIDRVSQVVVQVAIADVACVVLAPFAIGAFGAMDALRGTALVILGTAAFWLALRSDHRSRAWRRVHLLSEKQHYAQLTMGEGSAVILGALITLATVALTSLPWFRSFGTFGPLRRPEGGGP